MENYIRDLSRLNEDFPLHQVVRSPPPSRRVTLVYDVIEVVTTQDHLVEILGRRDSTRRHHYHLDADIIALYPLSITDEDSNDDFNKKKKFLLNALSNKLVNVHEEMNNSINILFENNKQGKELVFEIEVIAQFINNINYANDFVKLGGLCIFLPCFRSEHVFVRIKICEFICRLVQYNPYCQNKFMENTNCLKLQALMYMVENDTNINVRTKALAAIFSVMNKNLPVFRQFIAHGGKDLILYSLKSPIETLKIKAVLIICSTISHKDNDITELYVDNGFVEIISLLIMDMENNISPIFHDFILLTLNQLICLSPVRVIEICSSVNGFKQALILLRDSYSNQANHQGELEKVLKLIRKLTL